MTDTSDQTLLQKASSSIKKGEKSKNANLVVLMGLPGSGKSYVCNYLHSKHGYSVLSGENITFSLFGSKKCSGSDYALAYKTLRQLAVQLLKEGYSVVIDGTNLKYVFREQIYKEVSSSAYLIYLVVDEKTALSRVGQRGEDYTDKTNIKSTISVETFESFKNQLETPNENEKSFELVSDDNLLNNIDLLIEKIA